MKYIFCDTDEVEKCSEVIPDAKMHLMFYKYTHHPVPSTIVFTISDEEAVVVALKYGAEFIHKIMPPDYILEELPRP